MKKEIDKVNGCYDIYSNGRYVVLAGTKLRVFNTDGSQIICRDDIRYPGRITFLSNNRMMLSTGNGVIHLIDLVTGKDIWSVQGPKADFNIVHFAVTPDESCAYTFGTKREKMFIIRVDLRTCEVDSYYVTNDIGSTYDISCDENGVACILKVLYQNVAGQIISENGVLIQDYDDISRGNSHYWKSKWQFAGQKNAFRFWGDIDHILTSDLTLYEPKTGDHANLLENDTIKQVTGGHPSEAWLTPDERFLCLMYLQSNIIIDLGDKKICAIYAAEYTRGCIVENEYWICVGKRIIRKPFPLEEPIIKKNTTARIDEYLGKHPELW